VSNFKHNFAFTDDKFHSRPYSESKFIGSYAKFPTQSNSTYITFIKISRNNSENFKSLETSFKTFSGINFDLNTINGNYSVNVTIETKNDDINSFDADGRILLLDIESFETYVDAIKRNITETNPLTIDDCEMTHKELTKHTNSESDIMNYQMSQPDLLHGNMTDKASRFTHLKFVLPFSKHKFNATNLLNNTCYALKLYECFNENTFKCELKATKIAKTNLQKIVEDTKPKEPKPTEPQPPSQPKDIVLEQESQSYLVYIAVASAFLLIVLLLIAFEFRQKLKMNDLKLAALENKSRVRDFEIEGEMFAILQILLDDYVFTNDQFEVRRKDFQLTEKISSGNFGEVHLGIHKSSGIKVAIKKVLVDNNIMMEKAMIKETEIMKEFQSYHVVKLLGYILQSKPNWIVMELMDHMDLKSFLKQHDPNADSRTNNSYMKIEPIRLRPVSHMALEIADGMAYLESIHYIHRDLAARKNSELTNRINVETDKFLSQATAWSISI